MPNWVGIILRRMTKNNIPGKRRELAIYFKTGITITGIFFVALIGVVRYLTGPEWALSLVYFFPICIVTWLAGRGAGIIISFVSALSWLMADLLMIDVFLTPWVPYLNETFRLIVFLVMVLLLSELNRNLETQKRLARTDDLTEIANRRAFYELARMELNRARRFKRCLSLAYLDLDNFKAVNDLFGHSKGDQVLRSVADTIKDNTRNTDIIARMGGDEFAILLPETDMDPAFSFTRKLAAQLIDAMQTKESPVTFSIGIVTFQELPPDIDEIIKQADSVMYAAKQDGKNLIRQKVFN